MKLKTLLTTALLALPALLPASAQTLPQAAREKIIKATVMLLPTTEDGKLGDTLGTGSVISPDGYILTNYHVVGDNDSRTVSDWIQVRTLRFADQEPVPTYWGQVVASDPNLDLAIVKITETKDQKPVGSLNLPFVRLGDSNALNIGDPIYVFGFQGTGGMTVSYSQGTVSGFTGNDLQSSGRQWIKHDAQTGPGNSGGGVFDASGDLVGIHSAGLAGDHNSRTSFMRPLAVAWGLIAPTVSRYAVQPGTKVVASAPPASKPSSERLPSGGKSSGSDSKLSIVPITSWPPKIAPGQAWFVALASEEYDKGLPDSLNIMLGGLSPKGRPIGSATDQNNREYEVSLYYSAEEDMVWLDIPLKDPAFMSCRFDRKNLKAGLLVGEWLYYAQNQDKGTHVGGCSAGLVGGAANSSRPATSSAPGSAASKTPASNTPASKTPAGSSKLVWPLKPQPGQKYTFQIPSFGQVLVTLSGTDTLGATGKARLPSGTEYTTYFYYNDKEKTTWLDIVDGNSLLYCAFTSDSLSGSNLNGNAYYRKDSKNTQQDAETLGNCTGKLN